MHTMQQALLMHTVAHCYAVQCDMRRGLSKTYARIGTNHHTFALRTTFAPQRSMRSADSQRTAMCTVSENWQANPHLLLANIAHLYHYGGDEEEQ